MLYSICRTLAAIIFKILFRFDAQGIEHIPKEGAFILASNHTSYLDPIALGVACPRRLNFMARHDLFSIPLFSWLISNVGAFPLKRDSADLSAIKEAIRRLKNGNVLVLFPEGSRRIDGKSGTPQGGIGFLATKVNVPMIPAFIKGTQIALPKGAKFVRPTKVFVRFGKQISIERRMPYQDIARQIMENIRHLSC